MTMISLNDKKNCLLVDDDRDDQDIFKFALGNVFPEFRCIIAEDGDMAIRILQQRETTPKFVVMDINLPRLNGLECLAAIRKIHDLQEIPIFMYSTCGQSDIVQKCMSLGASGFYTKTSSMSELENSLRDIVSMLETSQKS